MRQMLLAPTLWASVLGTIIGAALAIVILWVIAMHETNRYIPPCQEDSVLIGYRQFERGCWESYRCGLAVDNYND